MKYQTSDVVPRVKKAPCITLLQLSSFLLFVLGNVYWSSFPFAEFFYIYVLLGGSSSGFFTSPLVFVQHCPLRLLIANSVLHFRKFVEWKGSRFVNVFWGTIISPSGLFRWPFNLVSGLLLLKTHILSWHLFLLFLKLFGSCKSNILSLLCSHHSAQAGQLHEDFMALSPQRTFSLEC